MYILYKKIIKLFLKNYTNKKVGISTTLQILRTFKYSQFDYYYPLKVTLVFFYTILFDNWKKKHNYLIINHDSFKILYLRTEVFNWLKPCEVLKYVFFSYWILIKSYNIPIHSKFKVCRFFNFHFYILKFFER